VNGGIIATIICALAALVLAVRGLRGRGLTFERGAMMVVAWIVIIGALAFVLTRVGI
jgi:hypothetical protein